jgi:hypothetical protein
MKPHVVVLKSGSRTRPPVCPWLVDNIDKPVRTGEK